MTDSSFRAFGKHVNPALAQFLSLSGRDQRFVRAQGCDLESDEGELYADWVSGFGSLNLGHNPPALLEALKSHLDEGPPNLYVESLNPFAGRLAEYGVAIARFVEGFPQRWIGSSRFGNARRPQ